ncbi:MAG: carbamoyl-phosphate synthase large subunit [Firmicutes bacterium]|nr:carbamoyl-phosphate synthase large subunit [Bacillota bacterium]
MPVDPMLRKVMVIGSGPIVIGQAAEFDYAGTQACRALQEEGLEVVLLNSNPATIMTDIDIADAVYIEPLTWETVEAIIARERPDGLLPTMGGQIGLNLAVEADQHGLLARYDVRLLGTSLTTIEQAEDREQFKLAMQELGEPVPESAVVQSAEGALEFAHNIGYPLIVRPAYTLGGAGGGIATDESELMDTVDRGLANSPIGQVLIERSVAGWKEIEYEVIRDAQDHCVVICTMENLDPVGIHTGDSIVVAPSQTLSMEEEETLRAAALRIVRALGIAGGCNVQFALHPSEGNYYVIEVNPRVSRSSALASKATGYPIARVAAKVAVGLGLDEIVSPNTSLAYADQEPVLDYVVVKIPRWPFDKFGEADRALGTQMKATGETMAIDHSFPAALMKAIRSSETDTVGLCLPQLAQLQDDEIGRRLQEADDQRLFLLAEAMYRGWDTESLHTLTGIDPWFLGQIRILVVLEKELQEGKGLEDWSTFKNAKKLGLADASLARIWGTSEATVRGARIKAGLLPAYQEVSINASRHKAAPAYYYSSYGVDGDVPLESGKKVLIIGSGPIRIGQGIEFDYCNVHCALELKRQGIKTIIINNNPETVSTDFDVAHRLYFEPLTAEDVLNVVAREQPDGAIVQFGGQTALNLAATLAEAKVPIWGTSVEAIDQAEDREKFEALLEKLNIRRPTGKTTHTREHALHAAEQIGYPVLVRPSYVLGGRAMAIIQSRQELEEYIEGAVRVSQDKPILIDKYLPGIELEVDAVSDGTDMLIPAIMQHVERAGIHSGDSIAFCPADLPTHLEEEIVDTTHRLAKALGVKGLLNIQYVVHRQQVYVLEVNPRASRTVPFLSKLTGLPLVALACRVALGRKLGDLGYGTGLYPKSGVIGVKMPVFSFAKLKGVDVYLSPEMKSTGECMAADTDWRAALHKAFLAGGVPFPEGGTILATIADRDKDASLPVLRELFELGFNICATPGTARFLRDNGIAADTVGKLKQAPPTVIDVLRQGGIKLVVNTMTAGKQPQRDGFRIRRTAVELGIPCFTSLDTLAAYLEAMQFHRSNGKSHLLSLADYHTFSQNNCKGENQDDHW